jgi:hypothetical protein
MALDPSIILGIKPVEVPDPASLAQARSSLLDQKQLRDDRTLQMLGIQKKQAESDAVDQSLAANTSTDPVTGLPTLDRAKVINDLVTSKHGNAAYGLQQNWAQQDLTQHAEMLKQQGEALKNAQSHNELLGGIANGILAAPPDQQPILYAAQRARLIQQKLVDPNEMPPDFNPDFVKSQQAQSMKASEVLAAHAKVVDQDQKSVQLAQEAANNAINQQLREREIQTTQRGQNLTDARDNQRLRIEAGRLHMEQAKNSLDQGGAVEAQAAQIAKGELPLPSTSRQNPYNKAVVARALEINPDLSSELYSTKQDFMSSKGKANAQVQSLNKLSAHLNELQDASGNAGFSPVGFTSSGKDLRLAEQLFSKEDVKFLSGSGVGTEGELNGLISKIHSPVQSVRDSAIQTLTKFTADAARQLGSQYERGTKLKFDPTEHFNADTIKLLQTNGGSGGKIVVTAPDGSKHPFETQSQADHFKQLAGIK